MKKATLILLLVFIVCLSAFIQSGGDEPVPIPPSKQRLGDAKKGYEYLVTGDYLKSGIPYNIFMLGMNMASTKYMQRDGLNKNLSYDYTAIRAWNNEVLVAPNCLQCHAQVFDDKLVIGLGNSMVDFAAGDKVNVNNIDLLERILKANAPKQYQAAAPFITVSRAITPHLMPAIRGVNTADRLASLLAAHRNPEDFKWNDQPQLDIPKEVVPSDTPPWWLLKKKNAMFYNGFGRGDFGRFLMASNLLTVNDTSESREVDEHMPDVLSYLYSLEAPAYPKTVHKELAAKGKTIFEKNCSGCHGTYGPNGAYPNLLIPASLIQTDSFLYQSNYSNPQFVNWFNRSWFTTGDHPASLQPFAGYLAPPLDGIWITAPYLHNGSVPNLEGVLNSRQRPVFWSRSFDLPQYDYEKIGWKYVAEKKGGGTVIYDTSKPGYGNKGHYFGDHLTDGERKAVIEYLKTI
jgi:hypothetical protein